MYLPIEQMPDHSRVWVYQANRPFSASETQAIENYLTPALTQWAAHGAGLNASFESLGAFHLLMKLRGLPNPVYEAGRGIPALRQAMHLYFEETSAAGSGTAGAN